MEYKGLKKDLLNEIFYTHLESAILNSTALKKIEYTNKELKGYINKLIDIFSSAKNKNGKYYIYASQFTNLERNQLNKVFNVFVRSENSTYHRNSSKISNNGYPHHYDIKDWFLKIYNHSLDETYRYIEFNKKYEKTLKECKVIIKKIKHNESTKKNKKIFENIDEYLKIDKDKFLKLFNIFKKGKIDFFAKYLENMFFYDSKFVYIDNNLNNDKIDKFNGLGRKYTLLNSNTPKKIRKYIFSGFTEIDIDSCSCTILCNLWLNDISKKNSKNDLSDLQGMYENLYKLITNKMEFRAKYQRILNTNENIIKKIITHLLFEPNSTKIYEKFSKEENEKFKENLLTLYEVTNPKKSILFNGLVRELIMMRKDVKDLYYGDKGFLYTSLEDYKIIKKPFINHLDIREVKNIVDTWFILNGSENNKSDTKIIHKIIEIVENQIRELIFEFLSNKEINDVYQVHDAFIFNHEIDLKELENFIFEKIGFVFKFSKEKY